MKFKIDGGIVDVIIAVTLFTWIMGSMMPVRTWCSKPKPRTNMVFRCEMVDGKIRDYTLNLPEKCYLVCRYKQRFILCKLWFTGYKSLG